MKKNWFKKLIVSVLCLTMVVQIPVQAGAVTPATGQQQEETAPPSIIEEITEEEEAYILYEIPEERETSVKHFRLSNGSYLAAQYDYPVHYQDENGQWQDYDNSLTLTDEVLDTEEEPVQQDANEEIASKATSPASEPAVQTLWMLTRPKNIRIPPAIWISVYPKKQVKRKRSP